MGSIYLNRLTHDARQELIKDQGSQRLRPSMGVRFRECHAFPALEGEWFRDVVRGFWRTS